MRPDRHLALVSLSVLAVIGLLALVSLQPVSSTERYLIRGSDTSTLAQSVEEIGGRITHEFSVIDAFGAELTWRQKVRLTDLHPDVRLQADRDLHTVGKRHHELAGYSKAEREALKAALKADREANKEALKSAEKALKEDKSNPQLKALVASLKAQEIQFKARTEAIDNGVPQSAAARRVGADELHQQGITGKGVTVAVLDTGIWLDDSKHKKKKHDSASLDDRLGEVIAGYDALKNKEVKGKDAGKKVEDKHGHGTHLSSVISGSDVGPLGESNGIAPGANLVVVKSFDRDGRGSYLDVIRGIDWVVSKREEHNIRVLNLSFSATPSSHYWDDPLNQAVMAAWQAGIVVVASAGNGGPDPMTIGVPGNIPYIVTVGALTDNFTPENPMDDTMASFSASGPTVEGFVKPEVIAPGGHLTGLMNQDGTVAKAHPEYHDGERYFTMSGTSQATAVVSGVVALLLEHKPWLSPDDVKCQLMAGAQTAVANGGSLAFSIFRQGAGLIDAPGALINEDLACANRGLNLNADLAGTAHFAGPANRDGEGNYYLMGIDGFLWSNTAAQTDAFLWSNAFLWSDGFLWSDAFLWSDGFLWSDHYDFEDGEFENAAASSASINTWVDQE